MNIISLIPDITVEIAVHMLPGAPHANIQANLPLVLNALVEPQLADKPMILMALATIRAETAGFKPLSEGESQYNTTAGGQPFDKYDYRADLGNTGPPDGERFRGRGFVQLTGRSNYALHGAAIGLGNQLTENPGLANDPEIAARLLASYLKVHEEQIRDALADHDLVGARKLVNGGTHGQDAFSTAYNAGLSLIPEEIAVVLPSSDLQSPIQSA